MSIKDNLTDEIIIAYLEGNLNSEHSLELEEMLREDDNLFLRMVDYYHTYKQIKETNLEVTPDQLINKAKNKFGISTYKKSGFFPKIKDRISNIISIIIQPRPALAFVASTFLILLILTNIDENNEDGITEKGDESEIKNILEGFDLPSFSPTSKKISISVKIENKILVIDQKIGLDRKVIIRAPNGKKIFEKSITSIISEFILADSILKFDKLEISIYDKDKLILEEIIEINH